MTLVHVNDCSGLPSGQTFLGKILEGHNVEFANTITHCTFIHLFPLNGRWRFA